MQTDPCFGVKRVSQYTCLAGESPVEVRQPVLSPIQTNLCFGMKRITQCSSLVNESPFCSCQRVLYSKKTKQRLFERNRKLQSEFDGIHGQRSRHPESREELVGNLHGHIRNRVHFPFVECA